MNDRPKFVSLKPSYEDIGSNPPATRRVTVEDVQAALDTRKKKPFAPKGRVAYLRKLTDTLAMAWTAEGKLVCNFTWSPAKAFENTGHIQIC